MKNKYQRLSSKEKKNARMEFKESEANHNKFYERLTRVRIVGSIGILYAIVNFIGDLFFKGDYFKGEIYSYIINGFLLVFCVYFIIKATELRNREVNQYLIDKGKEKKK